MSIRETRDRIRAASINSGAVLAHRCHHRQPEPGRACLSTTAAVPTCRSPSRSWPPPVSFHRDASRGYVFAAELGLDGRLRPVRGLVAVLHAAAEADGPVTAVIAPENWPEACTVPGVRIVFCQSLRQVIAWLRGQQLPREGTSR